MKRKSIESTEPGPAAKIAKADGKEDHGVPGLVLIRSFISAAEQQMLLKFLAKQTWSKDLSRPTLQYGFRYDYGKPNTRPLATTPFPSEIKFLVDRLVEQKIFAADDSPTQLIVNKYPPGQGITSHTDNTTHFGPVVCSLSLGSAVVMDLNHDDQHVPLVLPPCSLLVLTGDARTRWTHGIAKRKTDPLLSGHRIVRDTRISLTFRTLIE